VDESVKPRDLADVLPMLLDVGFKLRLETNMGKPSAVLIMPDGTEALLFFGHGRNDYRDVIVLGWINAWLERRHIYPHPTYHLSENVPWGMCYRDAKGYDLRMGTFSCGYDRYDVTITSALKAVGKIDWKGNEAAEDAP